MVQTYHDYYSLCKGSEYVAICKHHKLTRQEINSSIATIIDTEEPHKGISWGIHLLRLQAYNETLAKYIYRYQRGLRQ